MAGVHGVHWHVRGGLGRRRARHYGAILHRRGWRANVRSGIHRAERTVLCRLQADGVRDLGTPEHRGGGVDRAAVNGLTVDEGIAIRHGNRVYVMGIHEIDVANVGVENVRVANERVVDVHH